MGSTPVCYVDQNGIHRPDLGTCLAYFVNGYQGIYGSDVYLGSDSQDGELMGFLAAAVDDGNAMAVDTYNAFSPATAQGTGLSSNVKINGIARDVPSYSNVPVQIGGQFTSTITNGVLLDPSNNQWSLPASVTIPMSGQIVVTATCQTPGAIQLGSGVTLTMVNPTKGWQTAVTTAAATPGEPVETDPQLRLRQAQSTMIPSSTMLEGIAGAILTLPGVAQCMPYMNDGNTLDANGVPGHSIAIVVQGGDATAIANAIAQQKFAAATFGTTTEIVTDSWGITHPINFFYLSQPSIVWGITIKAGPTFSVNTIALIQNALATYTNALAIGQSIQISRVYQAAYLGPSIQAASAALQAALTAGDSTGIATWSAQIQLLNTAATTYEVLSIAVSRTPGVAPTPSDVAIAFNEQATCLASNVAVTVD